MRFLLLASVLLAIPATAQGPLVAAPRTVYVLTGAAFFTLTNPAAVPVTLDSMAVAFRENAPLPHAWFVDIGSDGNDCTFIYGFLNFDCAPDLAIGPGKSVPVTVGYSPCSTCLAPVATGDTLKIYAGGATTPTTVILDDSRFITNEGTPDADARRLTVQPSPARSTARVMLTAPDAVRVLVLDALGRRVVTLADGVHSLDTLFDISAWPPGVYYVVADDVFQRSVVRFTVVR